MKLNPDGEIELSVFTIDYMKWLEIHNKDLFDKYCKIILQEANENFKKTGKAYNSFDLQREIIENIEKIMSEENTKTNSN